MTLFLRHTVVKSTLLLSLSNLLVAPSWAQETNRVETPQEMVAPKTTATIEITATATAEVFIDNKPAGQTPLTVAVEPGKHTVRISANGFDPYVRRVTAYENQTATLHGDLFEGGGTVEFQASVSPATLILDDGEMVLPIRLNELSEGEHKWKIRANGYESAEGKFSFTAGNNVFIYRELESSMGKVLIESNPADALIIMDGENLGMGPLSLEEVDAGVHSVVIQRRGYATAFRTMDNTLGNKGIVKASLSKVGSKVTIKTKIKDANVYIEDHLVGTGKRVKVGKVEKGSYDIRIVADGYKTLQSDIHVPADGKATFVGSLIETEASGTPSLTKKGQGLSIDWKLWGTVAASSAVAGASYYFISQSNEPEPAPSGDAVINLP